MRFAMSYSCGKDSTLALHRMVEQGHEPVCLVVMVNEDVDRSYFHGADRVMLEQYSKALDLPLITCPTDGATYARAFEQGLARAKALGAEAVCFGDIDIEANRQWEEDRCTAVELIPIFPLWQEERDALAHEVVDKGYECLIKSIDKELLPKELLGKFLNNDSLAVMAQAGIDTCGENGEYHTLTIDGPLFKEPLRVHLGDILEFDDHATIECSLIEE